MHSQKKKSLTKNLRQPRKRFMSAFFILFFVILEVSAQSAEIIPSATSTDDLTIRHKSTQKTNPIEALETSANPSERETENRTQDENRIEENWTENIKPLTIAEAIDLALKQASNFQAAQINEKIAMQEIKQAKAALYPRIAVNPTLIYTTPSLSNATNGTDTALRSPSFLGANAITEYQGIFNAAGEIDLSRRLRATIKRNQLLLEAARAGTDVARRELINAVSEAYYNLALATLLRRTAEMNLQTAQEFENNVKLQLDAGEVAPIDLTRAKLQTAQRRNELEQARANEAVSADALRVLIGYDFATPVAVEDLLTQMPQLDEIENLSESLIQMRPELRQFEAEKAAALQEIKIAKSERKPQITYSLNIGFISDSLRASRIKSSIGMQVNIGISIPLFDWGASRARQKQAELRVQQSENNRLLAMRQFAQAFFSAKTQAESAALRIRQLAESIRDAEANVNASLARYQAGEASIIEVIDAQNTLIGQKQALYQAIFDYQIARSRLLRAVGQ